MDVSCGEVIRQVWPIRSQGQTAWVSFWRVLLVWSSLVLGSSVMLGQTGIASASERTEVAYAQGILAYDQGEYFQALEHFRTVVAAEPNNADAQFYLGLSHSRLDEFAAAITALEQAVQLDPGLRHVHHPLGVAYFQEARYLEALAQLQQAEQFDADNAATQFFQGVTLYLLKRYWQALQPLERAATLDATLTPQTSYYRGLALYELEQDANARVALTATRDTIPETALGRSAQSYLNAIAQREREQRLIQVAATVGVQYDDNVILEPNDDAFAFGNQDDGRLIFSADIKVVPVRTSRWRLGAGYQFFQSAHLQLDEFNIRTHTVGAFTRFKFDPVTINVEANYRFTLLDNENFSEAFRVRPSAIIHQTKSLFAEVSVRYRIENFRTDIPAGQDPAVRDRDGWNVRGGFDQYVLFNKERSYGRLGYYFEAQRNDGTDWEYNGHNIGLGLRTPVWGDLVLQVDGGYSRRDYLNDNSFATDPLAILTAADTESRQDDRFTASVALQWPLGSHLTLSTGYTHINNQSNIAFFDYRRNIVTLALTGRY